MARRNLLKEVPNNIILYESEIWTKTLELKKRPNSLVQRKAVLRIASVYYTMSAPAVLVTASTIHVDLLTAEWMEIYKATSVGNQITSHFTEITITKL